ncbi:transglutaminaseTgpA domain-containing protein [Actinoplanes sp. CA-142083]|uniref:transglutaminase family protein n=1 Tax=Actinoplanes sp. CA-142083 TaxID=3239903 RepID=UPI003D935E11
MTGRRRLGMVAAAATLLAAAPITSIFDTWNWLVRCILAVGLIAGAALLARTLRFPTWAQALSMIVVLLLSLTWMFPSGHEILIPTPATFGHFADLFTQAGQDTRSYGVPVPDRDGLLFVTVLGIGSVAIAVDLLTVVARRPALAGLPMLAIYSVPVAVYVDSVPVLPFIIGATGFLWLLVSDNIDRVRRFGRRFTGDGRDVDVWEPSPLAAAGRRLGVVGVAAAVLLPLLVPTVTGGLLSQITQSGNGIGTGGAGTGTGGRINLFASLNGRLTQGDTVQIIKLTTNEREPYYLRFGVADQLTNQGFGNRSPVGNSVNRGMPDPRGGTAGGDFQSYHAQIEVSDDLQQSMLPIYSNTVRAADLGGGWSYDPNQQVIFSNRQTTKGKKYNFDYVRANYSEAELRRAEPLNKDNPLRTQYTNTPPDAEVDTLVAGLVKGKTTEYDKMRALYDYFSKDNGFSYSLSTEPAGSSSQIAAFLKNKVGYCQQYAAALAWMARVAGIPARVAFGFTKGAQQGNSWIITNRNAHAWTEVYLQGFGWIPFDATPASSVAGSTRSDWAPDPDSTTPAATTPTGAAASGADSSVAPGNPDRLDRGLNDPTGAGAFDTGSGPTSYTALWIVAGLALLIALLLVPALRRKLVRRRRHAATAPKAPKVLSASGTGPPGQHDIVVTPEAVRAREDAHAAWDELLDTMIDFRIPVDPTETPRVTAQRLVTDAVLLEEPAAAATLLGTAEERARYARKPLQGGELTVALGRVRKGLARSATRRTRITATLFPPSVLLRWRLAMAEGSARSVAAGARLRDSLARFSPRRLIANRGR